MHPNAHNQWKRLMTLIVGLWLGGAVVWGQATADTTDYRGQFIRINKAYLEDSLDIVNLQKMATFYSQKDNPMYNLPLAERYICQAETLFTRMLEDRSQYNAVMKLIKQQMSIVAIRKQRKQIEGEALRQVTQQAEQMDATVLATFADAFANHKEISTAVKRGKQYGDYRNACRLNTLDAYYDFIRQYRDTRLADSAEKRLKVIASYNFSHITDNDSIIQIAEHFADNATIQQAAMWQRSRIAYANARKINTIEAYSSYLQRFPRGENYIDALGHLETLRAIEFGMLRTPSDFAHYAMENSELPLADTAVARLREMILKEQRTDAAEIYLKNFPLDDVYNDIFRAYYQWISAEGNGQPIVDFVTKYPNYPYQVALNNDLAIAGSIDSVDLTLRYTESDYARLSAMLHKSTGKKISFVVLQRLLQLQIARQEWAEALTRMHNFDLCFEGCCQREFAELDALLSAKKGVNVVQELPPDEMEHAIVHPSGQYLYFTHNEGGMYAIGYAIPKQHKGARWIPVGNVTLQDCPGQPTAYNFYDNGKHVLIGIEGDLYTAAVVSPAFWRIEERLPEPVNTEWFEGDAFMTEDGETLLLISDRPGGHNFQRSSTYYHGDYAKATDIYCFAHTPAGWGEAVNLGHPINTPYCERSPLLSRNMKTLYFVSDGHGGLGYGDVYRVTRDDVTDWTHWSTPVNLGKNVNGCFDESSIAFGKNERQLFITSKSPKGVGNSCYSMTTTHDTTTNIHNVRLDVSAVARGLRRIDLADPVGQYVKASWTGNDIHDDLHIPLMIGKDYVIVPYTDSLFIPEVLFRVTRKTDSIVLRGYTMEQLQKRVEPIPIRTIQYASGTATLSALAEYGLKNIGLFMLRNPQCQMEIIVQAAGSNAEICYDLSEQRAIALRSYLVDFGIDINRIHLSAYGNVNFKKVKETPEVSVRFF